jgi:hypothetical protein
MAILSQLPGMSSGPMLRVLGALLILVFGHLLVRVTRIILRRYRKRGEGRLVPIREKRANLITSFMNVGVIILALGYLNVGLGSRIEQAVVQQAPKLFSVVLIGVLGVIVINIAEKVLRDFFQTLGLKSYLREAGMSSASFNIFSVGIKVFLYLVLAQIILYQLELNIVLINQLLNAFSWAFAFLVAGVIFYTVKDLFQNLGAGFYLRNSRVVRPGEEVKIGDDSGEVKDVSLFGTKLETRDGFTVLKPNSNVIDSGISFKRAKSDLETLEDITGYFRTADPELSGPKSVEMAAEIFGVEKEQEDIEEAFEAEDIDETVDNLSGGGMKAAWIEAENISSLDEEYKAWFNDGALIVSRFDKEELFPNSDPGEYTLSIGAENSDILNIDPVESSSGGVYYVDSGRMEDLMDESEGYLVLAPEGTTAYWRIKKELVYSDKNLYDELSKTLENKLRKIMRQGRMLKDVSPDPVQRYIEKWGREGSVSRLWTPSGRDNSGSSGNN